MKQRSLLLVAMSGVRVKDEELRRVGMTLPGFVERGKVIASLPSLGLLTLAAYTPPHWHIRYIECDDLKEALTENWDIVAISALPARIYDAYAIADRLRAETTVVIGGLHATAMPEEALHHAHSVVIGEGEEVWPELLRDFECGGLQRTYSSLERRHWKFKECAPVPRYDLLDVGRYNRLTIQTTRGCPLDCSFCAASRLISRFKIKPIQQVRRELEAILNIWPRPFIELADDNTFVHKPWAKELATLLAEHPIRWFTETDISIADDEELLELLAESNCAQVLIGLESTNHGSLSETDSREWKRRQHEAYLEKICRIQSYGISVNGCFVLGFDHDGPDVFERTRDFVQEAGLSEVQITILTPFPGTALFETLKSEGRLLKDVFWDECTLFDVTYLPARMSVDELRGGFLWLARELYSDGETAQRKKRFRECVRLARRRPNAT